MREPAPRLEGWLRRLGLRPRVFGIGLSRTGTVTLAAALNELGVRTLHYPHDEQTFRELQQGRARLSVLRDYDGLTDIPVIPIYPALARAYPRAKFVLTVREQESWLRSVQRHWLRFPSSGEGEEPDPHYAFRRFTREAVYGAIDFDADLLRKRRTEHHDQVRAFFRDSPERLLVLDICGGEGWQRLCPFLGHPVRRRVFPWHHRGDWQPGDETPR